MRRVGWLLLAALLLPPIVVSASVAQAQTGRGVAARARDDLPRVVVVGVPGLRWSDVTSTDTPTLARLARTAAVGVLSVRTAAAVDCPTDGWLTLGAGNRVRSSGRHANACPATFPPPASLPDQVAANSDRREGAVPGLLAETLHGHGLCLGAAGPGAALGAAPADASVDLRNDDDVFRLVAGSRPNGDRPPDEGYLGCDVVVIQASAVGSDARATGAGAVDALVSGVDQLRPAGSTLIVVGLSEAPGDRGAHLHVALALGPGFRHGALTSASSRRPPYVQLVDVAPTILAVLGIATPDAMIGEPWRSTGAAPTVTDLRDHERKADAQREITVPFFVALVGVQVLLAGIGLLLRRWRVVELVALAGATAVGASYLANLYPWWRSDQPLAAMLCVTAVVTAGLTAISLLGRGLLARAGIACGLTAAVLVIDVLTGAHLQMSSVAGYSPVVAGRFAGIGNVAFGVLAASALLAAASTRSATVAALTAIVVVVDGAPMWGSDVGGVLALVPAYVLLVLLLAGRQVNAARLVLAAAAGGLVVVAFGVVDHARPVDQRTHLGRFVGQVLDGTAGGILRRKAEANLDLLFHSPVTALLPLVVAVLLVLFVRPPSVLRGTFQRSPAWRAGLLAVLTASGLGALLNDSGVAVPALAIVVAVPATLAVLARHARGSAGAG
jgi:hypothetical protein